MPELNHDQLTNFQRECVFALASSIEKRGTSTTLSEILGLMYEDNYRLQSRYRFAVSNALYKLRGIWLDVFTQVQINENRNGQTYFFLLDNAYVALGYEFVKMKGWVKKCQVS